MAGIAGNFVYGSLASPVTLNANSIYYIMTQESYGGDQWYDHDTTIQTALVGTAGVPVYSSGSSYVAAATGLPGETYVPVDFQYH